MNYVISGHGGKIFIRLSGNGVPETCTKKLRQEFEYSKARNVLDNLPKSMKRFHFKVEPVPQIQIEKISPDAKISPPISNKKKVIQNTYIVPECVSGWLNKVKNCNELAKDASKRKEELVHLLSDVDKELSNCLHSIELEPSKNGCEGFKEYKRAKNILEKRRIIKDELVIVSSILNSNLSSIASDKIEKVVNGLSNRKFTIREIEDENVIY